MTNNKRLPDQEIRADVVVIGAGPAGIVAALELADRGFDVCLIDSGTKKFSLAIQQLGDSAAFDPDRHAAMNLATRRQLGGATNLWGGRVLPYDPIDFAERDYIPHSDWPIGLDQLSPYYDRASRYFDSGRPLFRTWELQEILQKTIVPGLPDGDVLSSDLERWSLPTNFGREYRSKLERHSRIRLLEGLTCTKIETSSGDKRVVSASVKSLTGEYSSIIAKAYVIACGALETTRLLLNSGNEERGGLGNRSGALGRFYMGHISGRIARIVFSTDPRKTHYGFLRDRNGIYIRPRFTFSSDVQKREKLTNIAMWLVNSRVADHNHRNGVLSFVYLALRSPFGSRFASEAIRQSALKHSEQTSIGRHLFNVIRDFPRTLAFIPSFGFKRFCGRRRVPGFFQYSAANTYDIHYHGEQVPNPESQVTLSNEHDALGVARLTIDLRFSEQDVDSVIRGHDLLDKHLHKYSVGKVEYLAGDSRMHVWNQAADGYHQIGTTRMAKSEDEGVVDENCKVHGVDNLYVASSSAFVSSGQANTTFMIVVFALRLAEYLSKTLEQESPAITTPFDLQTRSV